MNKLRRSQGAAVVLLLWLGVSLVCGQSNPQAGSEKRSGHVIMISIDGLVPDYYTDPVQNELKVPNLNTLRFGGSYAAGVEGVYPTVTYPSHTTLVTGLPPARHGIVQNRIFEPPTGPQTKEWYWFSSALKAETLWTLARKAGLSTAAVGWPATAGAEIDFNVPEIYDPADRTYAWKRIAQNSTPGLLEKALGSDWQKSPGEDERRVKVSEYLIKSHRPNLLLIHLIELDGVHHRSGPRTPPARKMAEIQDAYIGRIMEATRQAGIFEQTTFLIVSDHGFAAINKKFAPNVVLAKEGLITIDANGKPTAWKAAAWPAGGSCAIVLRDPKDKATAEKVRELFTKLAEREGSPLKQVVTRQELNLLGAIPEAALMLDAAPGYSFSEELTGPEVLDSGKDYQGTHGYLPSRPEMRASLIIYGAGVNPGV
ncbi:MAG TPA: ectonucleotide pyrophosphatase/phosphodiesterase, partial [Blastocatellia bacterium]|nr:ectonucleotide pyrophosphatase/phosphodiesterase [Blastocatellia bacterium]